MEVTNYMPHCEYINISLTYIIHKEILKLGIYPELYYSKIHKSLDEKYILMVITYDYSMLDIHVLRVSGCGQFETKINTCDFIHCTKIEKNNSKQVIVGYISMICAILIHYICLEKGSLFVIHIDLKCRLLYLLANTIYAPSINDIINYYYYSMEQLLVSVEHGERKWGGTIMKLYIAYVFDYKTFTFKYVNNVRAFILLYIVSKIFAHAMLTQAFWENTAYLGNWSELDMNIMTSITIHSQFVNALCKLSHIQILYIVYLCRYTIRTIIIPWISQCVLTYYDSLIPGEYRSPFEASFEIHIVNG